MMTDCADGLRMMGIQWVKIPEEVDPEIRNIKEESLWSR